jgi:hypothetical protein
MEGLGGAYGGRFRFFGRASGGSALSSASLVANKIESRRTRALMLFGTALASQALMNFLENQRLFNAIRLNVHQVGDEHLASVTV